jgi:hypothetical protein
MLAINNADVRDNLINRILGEHTILTSELYYDNVTIEVLFSIIAEELCSKLVFWEGNWYNYNYCMLLRPIYKTK